MKNQSPNKIRWRMLLSTGVIALALIAASCSNTITSTTTATTITAQNKNIDVFAGSASQPPLLEAAKIFEQETNIKVNFTFGGSGTVLSQMILSKSGDIYIPGSPDYLIKAQSQGVVAANDNGTILAYLVPSILVQKGNPKNIHSLSDLLRPDVTAGIANPASVCVGLYAIEVLDKSGLLDKLAQAGTVKLYATSCENTATLIALKSVDAVIGWSVFASWNPDTTDVVYLKASEIPRLAYIPGAISTFAQDRASAQKFIDFLASKDGQAIFLKYGYQVSESEAKKFAPDATVGGVYNLPTGFTTLVK
jgi:molybdate transport system substrate-binding protein